MKNISFHLNRLYHIIALRKKEFLMVFFVVILLTYAFLYIIDFLPEPVGTEAAKKAASSEPVTTIATSTGLVAASVAAPAVDAYPNKITFPTLDNKTVVVQNASTTNEQKLDTMLLRGTVRYPTSATLTSKGNMLIFGHSSYLPTVFNKNYQSFNGIQNLQWGDMIIVDSTDTEYDYRVDKVYKAKASDGFIADTPGVATLTLSTCNSFATKDDRFIVQATLVSTKSLK